jgi:hypothetical protein
VPGKEGAGCKQTDPRRAYVRELALSSLEDVFTQEQINALTDILRDIHHFISTVNDNDVGVARNDDGTLALTGPVGEVLMAALHFARTLRRLGEDDDGSSHQISAILNSSKLSH